MRSAQYPATRALGSIIVLDLGLSTGFPLTECVVCVKTVSKCAWNQVERLLQCHTIWYPHTTKTAPTCVSNPAERIEVVISGDAGALQELYKSHLVRGDLYISGQIWYNTPKVDLYISAAPLGSTSAGRGGLLRTQTESAPESLVGCLCRARLEGTMTQVAPVSCRAN